MGFNCVGNETFEEYKAKIENIVEQLLSGKKHLVIWGAGENGERFKRYCDAIHIPVQYLVDSNPALWGTERWGVPIVAPKELGQLENIIVLISFPNQKVVKEVVTHIEKMICKSGTSLQYFGDILFFLLQNAVCGRMASVTEIITSMYRSVKDCEYLNAPHLDCGIITTRCNLKCRDCILKIPYLKEHKDRLSTSLWADMDRTLEIVDSITEMEVCGGESFLYGELIPFLEYAKKYSRIFSVCVITNGTIVPDEAVFDVMKNSNITLRISDYGEISTQKYVIEKKCKEKGIPCWLQNCSWLDLSPTKDLNYSSEELRRLFSHCGYQETCIRNWDGIIYRCGFQRVWSDLGLVDDTAALRKDGVDLRDRTNDKELKKRLREYLTTTVPFEICKYCKGNTAPIPRAIQL